MKTTHSSGTILVIISAITFSTAGLFTKGVSADAWTVIFWRGISATLFTLIYAMGVGSLRDEARRFGWPALLAMLFMASGTAAFIPAFKLTSVANVALIWASAPLVAALLAWLLLNERPPARVMLASLAAILGVGIVVSGSLSQGNLTGDLLALWMVLMMTLMMLVYRKWPKTPVALPNILASLMLMPLAMSLSQPFQIAAGEIPILIAFGLIFAVASVTMTEGARRLPPAQTALLGALETPLAPVWAFLLLSEVPTGATITGGVVIMLAVLWSQMKGMG